MQTITIPEFLSRLGGGAIGMCVACVWCFFRVSYRESIQKKLSEHDHAVHDYAAVETPHIQTFGTPAPQKALIHMPAMRLSMQGSTYF
jgi:hypothetical protein